MKIDPELKYCPQCGDEYRADMVECFSCEVQLISGEVKLGMIQAEEDMITSRSMDISSEDNLVTLQKGALNEMKQLRDMLAAVSIPTLIVSDEDSCGQGCCGTDVLLQIKHEDGEGAVQVLAREFKKSTSLDGHDLSNINAVYDSSLSETVCPACGTKFSTSTVTCPDCGLCFG